MYKEMKKNMKFTDDEGRKIETRSGIDVTNESDGFPIVELYINGKFVYALAMMQYNSENVAGLEEILFEEYGISF